MRIALAAITLVALTGCDTTSYEFDASFGCSADVHCGVGYRCVSQKCRVASSCAANEVCGDGLDNDCNGKTDCKDPECAPGCMAVDSGIDSGVVDSGVVDSGVVDSGVIDSGVVDSGVVDSGVVDSGVIDSGVVDSGVVDSGVVDSGVVDSGVVDSGVIDSGVIDSGVVDSGVIDSGVIDSGVIDSGIADAGRADSGVADSGTPDAGVVDAGPPFPTFLPLAFTASDGGGTCGIGGWCWVSPVPFLISDYGIDDAQNTWAISADGVVARNVGAAQWQLTTIANGQAEQVLVEKPGVTWFRWKDGGASRVDTAAGTEQRVYLTDAGSAATTLYGSPNGSVWLATPQTLFSFTPDAGWLGAPRFAGVCQTGANESVAPLSAQQALLTCTQADLIEASLLTVGAPAQLIARIDGGSFNDPIVAVADSPSSVVVFDSSFSLLRLLHIRLDGGVQQLPTMPGSNTLRGIVSRVPAPSPDGGALLLAVENTGYWRLTPALTWEQRSVTVPPGTNGVLDLDEAYGRTWLTIGALGVVERQGNGAPVAVSNTPIGVRAFGSDSQHLIVSPALTAGTNLVPFDGGTVTSFAGRFDSRLHAIDTPRLQSWASTTDTLVRQPLDGGAQETMQIDIPLPDGGLLQSGQRFINALATTSTGALVSGIVTENSGGSFLAHVIGPGTVALRPPFDVTVAKLRPTDDPNVMWVVSNNTIRALALPSMTFTTFFSGPSTSAIDACQYDDNQGVFAGIVASQVAVGRLTIDAGTITSLASPNELVTRAFCDRPHRRAFIGNNRSMYELTVTPTQSIAPSPFFSTNTFNAVHFAFPYDGSVWVIVQMSSGGTQGILRRAQ